MHQVDVHFHALWALDDGPAELADSLALLGAARDEGTDTVVATPHVRSDFVTDVADLTERVAELAPMAAELGVRLLCGGELGHDMVGRLHQHELELIAQGPADGRWLLLETPFTGIDDCFHAAAEELRDRGYGVVLAHPERSADAICDGAAGLRHELGAGALAQVNAGSVTGAHGPDARRAALALIRAGLVDSIASDAHGPTRPPLLTQARARLLEDGVEAAAVDRLVCSGPRRLLARGLRARVAAIA